MSVYRTNNPTEFDDVDGIVIDESAPPPAIQGAASNIALLVGQFPRGPEAVVEVGSLTQLNETFGTDASYPGVKALKNKKFGSLKIRRVVASGGAVSTLMLTDGGGTPVNILRVDALSKGVDAFKVLVENGTGAGTKKITISDFSVGTKLPNEVYDNVDVTAFPSAAAFNAAGVFAGSKMVAVTCLSVASDPANIALTALAGGSDGVIADADYLAALEASETTKANVVFLDEYTSARRDAMEQHVANTRDRSVVISGARGDSVATAVTAVGNHRDTDGRIIYSRLWVQTTIDGVPTMVSPAPWIASIISQTAPNVDPAYSANVQFTTGITGLDGSPTRQDYITLKNAGIADFEFDSDLGYKLKSGVVTQIADSSKTQILRRRMADYLTESASRFLKSYQNAPNTKANRTAVGAAILNFVLQNERDEILPKDNEVDTKRAKLIDTNSKNTDASIGAGMFIVVWKQRIYSSMRNLVIQAQIGETVTVSVSE